MMRLKRVCDWCVVVSVLVSLMGCTMQWQPDVREKVADETLLPTVARVIEEQKDVVWDYLDEDISRSLEGEQPSGDEIVHNTLSEEHGRDYLEFCYAVNDVDDDDQVDTVIAYAKGLVDEQQMEALEDSLDKTRSLLLEKGAVVARSLAPSQRAAFWKDMQKLVVKTLVLFTAGVVYACIPHVVFWGKVSAASAVAIASGVVASTLMSIWRYYQFGGDLDQSFSEWLLSVTKEPELAYAVATSTIAVGQTLDRGPVVTGIILCVFAIYNVVDMLKPMLKQYDFTV